MDTGYIIRCLVDIIFQWLHLGIVMADVGPETETGRYYVTRWHRAWSSDISTQRGPDCIRHYNDTFSFHCLCLQGRSSDSECPLLRRWHSPSPCIHQVMTFANTEHPSPRYKRLVLYLQWWGECWSRGWHDGEDSRWCSNEEVAVQQSKVEDWEIQPSDIQVTMNSWENQNFF